MKPAVIMMFRDEADILGKCLEHWYALGVRDFYLCDNGSVDDSFHIAKDFFKAHPARHIIQECWQTDWPGRRVINDLKNRALADGCDWIFPADADEFLVLPDNFQTIQGWLSGHEVFSNTKWLCGELRYLNVLPDGREEWQEPQRKVFGVFDPHWMISMGNHMIEGVVPNMATHAHYRHYSLRSYPQFKRKMKNYMTAFSQNGFTDHHHAESFRRWQVEGETYLQNLWTELTGLPPCGQ